MKRNFQIVAGMMAIYVLSLPIILIFHSQTHSPQDSIKIVTNDFDHITTQDNSDCQICSFYFDQQLYVQNSFVCEFDAFTYYFHQTIVETPIAVSEKQHYLRGPPTA